MYVCREKRTAAESEIEGDVNQCVPRGEYLGKRVKPIGKGELYQKAIEQLTEMRDATAQMLVNNPVLTVNAI